MMTMMRNTQIVKTKVSDYKQTASFYRTLGSVYAITRPSVVRLSAVTFVHHTQGLLSYIKSHVRVSHLLMSFY